MDLLNLINVQIRFRNRPSLHFSHHVAMYATILDRLGNPDSFPEHLAFFTPERGRVQYKSGDLYNIGFATPAVPDNMLSPVSLERTLADPADPAGPMTPARVVRLIASLPRTEKGNLPTAPFGSNYEIVSVVDAVSGEVMLDRMPRALTLESLSGAASRLARAERVEIRILSPMKFMETIDGNKHLREGDAITGFVFLKTLKARLSEWWPGASFLEGLDRDACTVSNHSLIRGDIVYPDKAAGGRVVSKVSDGVIGSLTLDFPGGVGRWAVPLLLGGIIGVTRPSNLRMGQGRYSIAGHALPAKLWPPQPVRTILQRAAEAANVRGAANAWTGATGSGAAGSMLAGLVGDAPPDDAVLRRAVESGTFKPAPLEGILALEKAGPVHPEVLRAITIPSREDLFAQLVVLQELTPAFAQNWKDLRNVYGDAGTGLTMEQAYAQARNAGFRYSLDAEMTGTCAGVDWDRLRLALDACLAGDPVVDLLMNWVCSSVTFGGKTLPRVSGLPVGAPVTPLLAHVYLALCGERRDRQTCELAFRFLSAAYCEARLWQPFGADEKVTRVFRDMPYGLAGASEVAGQREWLDGFVCEIAASTDVARVDDTVFRRRRTKPSESASQSAGLRDSGVDEPSRVHEIPRPCFVTPPARISSSSRNLFVGVEGAFRTKTAWREVSQLVIQGNISVSARLVKHATDAGVSVVFRGDDGSAAGIILPEGRLAPPDIPILQWEWMKDDDARLGLARRLVAAGIRNIRMTARRRREDVSRLKDGLTQCRKAAEKAGSVAVLADVRNRGLSLWYSEWNAWTRGRLGDFCGRCAASDDGQIDAMFALLDEQLFNLVLGEVVSAGLDPHTGVLGIDGESRPALAADMMEPFRFVVDRVVLNAVNHRLLGPADFIRSEKGPYNVRLSHAGMTRLIQDFETLMSTGVADKADRQATFREHLYRQVMSLRQVVEGVDGARFQPFELKW